MIPKELLIKYNMASLEEYKQIFNDASETDTELMFYDTFLKQTDHIPNKIIEAQALGNTPNDYTEILNHRQFARDEINRIKNV